MRDDTFVLLTTVPIKAGCEAEYLALVYEVSDQMRHEPTFVDTVLHRSADDAGLFMLQETWRDRADYFAVQMRRPYRARYEARLPELLRAPREMKVFEPLRTDRAEATADSAPVAALERFYAAEANYMAAGGARGGASFAPLAETLAPDVVLHQSPDLPWGGEFYGHAGYEDWARQMSEAFDALEVKDRQLVASGDTAVAICRLVTRSRVNGSTINAPMAQVVRVREGRIVEFRPFYWNAPDYRDAVGSAR
ncbi:nuclear transport factor 2 family protein [Sphingomonas sp.]|uniref:nuclear transport factor 2 family protein n=1 Tax=Sphingomonas sp. TaxID=28214 RepID=UPI003B0081CA